MNRFSAFLVVPGLLLGSIAASAQRASVAPPWSTTPEPAFVAPRFLTDLTQGPSTNRGVDLTGDVDNDGDVDLLAREYADEFVGSPRGIQIWRNEGGGDFAFSHTVLFTPPGPLQLADITGDGVLDIVCYESAFPGGAVHLRPGLGNGQFGADTTFSDSVAEIVTGDGDGDGDLDLLVRTTAYDLSWWRHEGSGFVSGSSLSVPSQWPQGLATLDIEGDGVADAVAFAYSSSSSALRFFRTTSGAPTLDKWLPLPAELEIGNRRLRVGDLDGDGDDDVLVVADDVLNWRFLFQPVWNGPTGFTLAPLQVVPTPALNAYDLSIGELVDWDEDGDVDYLSPNFVWMENTGDAVFSLAGNVYWSNIGSTSAIQVADLDSDGHLDALLRWACLYGDGDLPSRVSNPERNLVSFYGWMDWRVLEDWEGDGDLDFVGSEILYLNNGEGSFVERSTEPPDEGIVGQLVEKGWGDFDGDGFRDLVVEEAIYPDPFTRMLFFTGTEDGTYLLSTTVPSPIEMGAPDSLAGDIDGDGDVDILTQNGFWANDGQGHFGTSVVAAYTGKPLKALDLEGDGDLDLFVTVASGMRVLRNLGGLGFEIRYLGPSSGLQEASFLDVDEDGDLDVVTTHDPGPLKVFEQLPDGGFAPPLSLAAPGVAGPAGLIDVNGDHRRDLVASRSFDGFHPTQILTVWYRGQGLSFDGPHEWATPEAPRAFGDIDRDGDVEPLGAASFENLRHDGPADGFALQYGLDAATSGTGGIHPVLGSGAPARPGRLAELVIGRGRGGAFGVLLAGDERDDVLDGGIRRLVASPSTPRSFVLGGTPGAAGAGKLSLSVNVVSALIGRTRVFQVVLVDPEASGGLSATNGLEVRFGD